MAVGSLSLSFQLYLESRRDEGRMGSRTEEAERFETDAEG